jgi:hypothetical protein
VYTQKQHTEYLSAEACKQATYWCEVTQIELFLTVHIVMFWHNTFCSCIDVFCMQNTFTSLLETFSPDTLRKHIELIQTAAVQSKLTVAQQMAANMAQQPADVCKVQSITPTCLPADPVEAVLAVC